MVTVQKNQTFAALFKKYRLRSEIETLSQFGDLLAQEGLVYENSLFTHWQKGDRVPKDRRVVTAMIAIFTKCSGISTKEEANSLLRTVEMRDLNEQEEATLNLKSEVEPFDKQTREPPIYNVIFFLIHSILRSRFPKFLIGLLVLEYVWFIRVNTLHLQDTQEAFILNWIYGFNALSGILYICFRSRYLHTHGREHFETLKIIGVGLLGQWLGLQIWTYYNLTGDVVPYPSFADVCYFGGILCYVFLSWKLIRRHAFIKQKIMTNKRSLVFFTPIIILLSFYSYYWQASGFSFIRQITVTLNSAYPLMNATPIILIAYIFAFSRHKISHITSVLYALLIVAFSFQFLADYFFVYSVQMKDFVNGGLSDIFYATSYAMMSLVIVSHFYLLQYRSISYPKWISNLAIRYRNTRNSSVKFRSAI